MQIEDNSVTALIGPIRVVANPLSFGLFNRMNDEIDSLQN